MNKTCIIVAGPTAVGKTAAAIDIAVALNTEIISADSRQCYKELNIGVAKPSLQELATVQHYFINSHSIQQTVTAADFEEYALDAVAQVFSKKDIAVMVGGTGLYIKAFCEGLDPIPPVPAEIREKYTTLYEAGGLPALQEWCAGMDPLFYASGEILNPQRLMRALEVMEATGRSINSYQSGNRKQRDFDIIKYCLDLPREILYDRINQRVDQMMEQGLLEEAKALLPYRSLNALQTVGYTELFDYFDGQCSLQGAIDAIKQHTRNYAKRQLTWFKKQGFRLIDPSQTEDIIAMFRR